MAAETNPVQRLQQSEGADVPHEGAIGATVAEKCRASFMIEVEVEKSGGKWITPGAHWGLVLVGFYRSKVILTSTTVHSDSRAKI